MSFLKDIKNEHVQFVASGVCRNGMIETLIINVPSAFLQNEVSELRPLEKKDAAGLYSAAKDMLQVFSDKQRELSDSSTLKLVVKTGNGEEYSKKEGGHKHGSEIFILRNLAERLNCLAKGEPTKEFKAADLLVKGSSLSGVEKSMREHSENIMKTKSYAMGTGLEANASSQQMGAASIAGYGTERPSSVRDMAAILAQKAIDSIRRDAETETSFAASNSMGY